MSEYVLLYDELDTELENPPVGLLLLTDIGCFYRDAGEWVILEEDNENYDIELSNCLAVDATAEDTEVWDSNNP